MADIKKDTKKTIRGRVFNIMQFEENPKTGQSLNFNEENIKNCIKHKSIKEWAYILHDKDEIEEEINHHKTGKKIPKGKHWHLVISCPNPRDIEQIAKWLNIPSQYIGIPKGRGSFLDCVKYLTHEDEKQQEQGKFLYNDDEVKANFNWRKLLDDREAIKIKYGRYLDETEQMFHDILYNGKTIRQCIDEDEMIYLKNIDKVKKYRNDYISRQPSPSSRINFYITSTGGGMGKDLISRALARSLFPNLEYDEDIFFEVGTEKSLFEGYDGQPVIIWSDYRAYDLIHALGDRGNVFRVFDTHPSTQKQNIKYSSINLINTINIVNSVQPYKEFLDGLAGEYKDKNGVVQKSELKAKSQSYRRFPFIMPLYEDDFELLINKGYMENNSEFLQYYQYASIRGNMAKISQACKNNELLAKQIQKQTLAPVSEKILVMMEEQNAQDDEAKILKQFSSYGKKLLNLNKDDGLPF